MQSIGEVRMLKSIFRIRHGRELGKPGQEEVVNPGNPGCRHERVLYSDNFLIGQELGEEWKCEVLDCGRHQKAPYSPGFVIDLPRNVFISNPNSTYGGKDFYSFRTDNGGVVEELPRELWIARE